MGSQEVEIGKSNVNRKPKAVIGTSRVNRIPEAEIGRR